MVHLRLNTREANPNEYINFITALPGPGEDSAKEILRALVAQVKPVMKKHGFTVNSFEEYEFNKVFAGRNWEAGETIEIVLRGPNGSFYPFYSLLNTLCHELAHIRHMHHAPVFHKLWAELREEVNALRAKGYFGDGYWSVGYKLGDGSSMISPQDLEEVWPEYVCGGAHSKPRANTLRRRRRSGGGISGPSTHTGSQTAKRRKAGSRIASKASFVGEGQQLTSESSSLQTGFRKRANTKKASAERAALFEKRFKAQAGTSASSLKEEEEDSGSEEDEVVAENDSERRKHLLETVPEQELLGLKMQHEMPDGLAAEGTPLTEKVSAASDANNGASENGRGERHAEITGEPSGSQSWECSACTFLNPPLFLACDMCSGPKL